MTKSHIYSVLQQLELLAKNKEFSALDIKNFYQIFVDDFPPQITNQEANLIHQFAKTIFRPELTKNLSELQWLRSIFATSCNSVLQETFLQECSNEILNLYQDILATSQELTIENRITILSQIITSGSKVYWKLPKPAVAEIALINNFISRNPLVAASELRNKPFTMKNRNDFSDVDEKAKMTSQSLLFCIASIGLNAYNSQIFSHLLKQVKNLNHRDDLLGVMICNATLPVFFDMSQTFDELVAKGIPQPSETQTELFLQQYHQNNLSKLIRSFSAFAVSLFENSIHKSDFKTTENLLKNFDIKLHLNVEEVVVNEDTPLLAAPPTSFSAAGQHQKLSKVSKCDRKYLDLAIAVADRNDAKEGAVKITKLLLDDVFFQSEKSESDLNSALQKIGIETNSNCWDCCTIS